MQKPVRAHFNHERRTSTLYFDPNDLAGSARQYMMRGGICWPVLTVAEVAGGVLYEGFALLAGQDTVTGEVLIFEQARFSTVAPVVDPKTMVIKHPGLAPFFTNAWARYYATHWFWKQPDETSRTYRLEVYRLPAIMPKPILMEVDWADYEQAQGLAWRYVQMGKILFEAGSDVDKALVTSRGAILKKTTKVLNPVLHALQCLLVGLERWPWRGDNK